MAEGACILDREQRTLVEQTIEDHCRIRGWELHAVNCRSSHVHVVLTAAVSPAEAREQLKAWSTRRLKERDRQRLQAERKNWWAERGSGRFINDEAGLENVIHYVRDLQDAHASLSNTSQQPGRISARRYFRRRSPRWRVGLVLSVRRSIVYRSHQHVSCVYGSCCRIFPRGMV